jgi:hypothetical protein
MDTVPVRSTIPGIDDAIFRYFPRQFGTTLRDENKMETMIKQTGSHDAPYGAAPSMLK